MSNDYIIRVGDGINFINSARLSVWAVKSKYKTFLNKVKKGDKLWFVRNKLKTEQHSGKIIAVADFVSKNERILGPLISTTLSNDELGWDEKSTQFDIEIHYNNLYNLTECDIFTGLKGRTTICEYNNVKESILINLIVEYLYLSKYSKITNTI